MEQQSRRTDLKRTSSVVRLRRPEPKGLATMETKRGRSSAFSKKNAFFLKRLNPCYLRSHLCTRVGHFARRTHAAARPCTSLISVSASGELLTGLPVADLPNAEMPRRSLI